MVYQLQRSHLFCRLLYCLSELRVLQSFSLMLNVGIGGITESIVHVDRGGSALEDTEGSNNRWRHSILRLIDLEVLERSFGLSAPVLVRRDLDFPKGIAFCSGRLRPIISN